MMLLITMALCVSGAAQSKSQDDKGPVFAKTPRNNPSRLPLTIGAVEGNTYKNDSLGLQFTPPTGLKFSAPELKGKPGTLPLLVTVAAWGELTWISANGGTVFYADDLGYYPEDRRSTKAYVERVGRTQKDQGLELVEGTTEGQLGGVTFTKVDFRDPSRYEAVFVKSCNVYAFVFIFAGPDLNTVNKLIAETKVKLDVGNSGCGGMSQSTPQKK